MKIQLAAVGIVAAMSFVACETAPVQNANRVATNVNSNTAVVVNSNSSVVGNAANSVTTNGNANRSSVNYNGTVKENEAQRSSIEAEAKQAGRTIGAGANDWWLWGKTRAQLAATNELRDSTVDVDVDNAVVTLGGTVANAAQKTKAEQVAKSIEGVKTVKNNLKVNANDTVLPNVTNSNSGSSNTGATKKS